MEKKGKGAIATCGAEDRERRGTRGVRRERIGRKGEVMQRACDVGRDAVRREEGIASEGERSSSGRSDAKGPRGLGEMARRVSLEQLAQLISPTACRTDEAFRQLDASFLN